MGGESNIRAVVRHERRGLLIWSCLERKYYTVEPGYEEQILNWLSGDVDCDDTIFDASNALGQLGIHSRSDVQQIFPVSKRPLSAPLEAYVDYTWVCNLAKLKCGQDSFCYASPNLGQTTLHPDEIRSLLSQLRRLGVMKVHLAGGEPTSNPKLLDLYLKLCEELGLGVSFTTNGTMITPEIISMLDKYTVSSVTVSVDGADEARFAATRGKNLFPRVIAGINLLVSERERLDFETRIHMKSVFMPSTHISDIEDLIKLGCELKVDSLKLNSPEKCTRHNVGHYSRMAKAYYKQLRELNEIKKLYEGSISISLPNNPASGGFEFTGLPETKGCIGGQELICFNPNGTITPCAINPFELAGSNDWTSVEDFWEHSATLDRFIQANEPSKICGTCNLYGSCKSGSTARKISEYGVEGNSLTYQALRDPYCPKDFLSEEEHTTPLRRNPRVGEIFIEINVAHSL